MISERDDLLRQRTTLHTQIKDNKGAVSELQRKLAALASELELNARQLKYGQATCGTLPPARRTRSSRRRSFRRIGLMRFLEEVRTKVVELMDEKLVLGDNVDTQGTIHARDGVISGSKLCSSKCAARRSPSIERGTS